MNTDITFCQPAVPASATQAGAGVRRGMYRGVLVLAVAALAGIGSTARANVANGSFETFSNASNGGCSSSQQEVNGGSSSNLSSWTTGTGNGATVPNTSYTFVLGTSNYSSFTPIFADNGNCNALALKPTITASPDGGNFVATDPLYENSSVYTLAQTITGLVAGATYNITFYMGAGQQTGFTGPTTDDWVVGLGATAGSGPSGATGSISPGSGGAFSGWVGEEISLIANATSEVLWFLGQSTALASQPPFLLLDGVAMTQTTTVPEPPAYGMLIVGLIALLGARRVWRAQR
jgi:hypothetical protein